MLSSDPGDTVVGFMSSGKGIVVHQKTCPDITEEASENRQLSVQWSDHFEGEYLVFIRVQVTNECFGGQVFDL